MEAIQLFLSACGAVSIVGGAGAVIMKIIMPAFYLTKRIKELEDYNQKDFERLQALEEMQK